MANIYDMADTWNDAGTTFTAIKMDVTDTASASGSLLMDLQVGGSSKFSVHKSFGNLQGGFFGGLMIGGTADAGHALITASGIIIPTNTVIGWSNGTVGFGTPDTMLARDAANTLAQRNSTNAQTFNLYNTYTDASNYERARMGWNANVFEIAPQSAGTGTTRVLHISGLPTANPGPGILWNDAGTVKVGT